MPFGSKSGPLSANANDVTCEGVREQGFEGQCVLYKKAVIPSRVESGILRNPVAILSYRKMPATLISLTVVHDNGRFLGQFYVIHKGAKSAAVIN